MLFMPLPFMRGFGIGGLVIPLVSVVCALTLLPVLLYFLVATLDRVRLVPRAVVERREVASELLGAALARDHAAARPSSRSGRRRCCSRSPPRSFCARASGPGSNKGIPQDLEGDPRPQRARRRRRRRRARADGDRDRHRRARAAPQDPRSAPRSAGSSRASRADPEVARGRVRPRARSTSTRPGSTCTSR